MELNEHLCFFPHILEQSVLKLHSRRVIVFPQFTDLSASPAANDQDQVFFSSNKKDERKQRYSRPAVLLLCSVSVLDPSVTELILEMARRLIVVTVRDS